MSSKLRQLPATDEVWARFKRFAVGYRGQAEAFVALLGLAGGQASSPSPAPDPYLAALDKAIQGDTTFTAEDLKSGVDTMLEQFGTSGLGRPVEDDEDSGPKEYVLKPPANISLKQVGDSYGPFTTLGDGIWRDHAGEVVSPKDSAALDKLTRAKGYELVVKEG